MWFVHDWASLIVLKSLSGFTNLVNALQFFSFVQQKPFFGLFYFIELCLLVFSGINLIPCMILRPNIKIRQIWKHLLSIFLALLAQKVKLIRHDTISPILQLGLIIPHCGLLMHRCRPLKNTALVEHLLYLSLGDPTGRGHVDVLRKARVVYHTFYLLLGANCMYSDRVGKFRLRTKHFVLTCPVSLGVSEL